jgi:hypothetical protein
MTPHAHLPGLNGYGAGCREKLKMLAGDGAEKSQVPCDTVLVGVAEWGLAEIAGLDFPKRPAA